MYKVSHILIGFCLLILSSASSASAQLSPEKEDSLRISLQQSVDQISDWIESNAEVPLDTLQRLLDSVRDDVSQRFGNQDILMASVHYAYSRLLFMLGDNDEALRLANIAMQMWERDAGDHRLRLLDALAIVWMCHGENYDLAKCALCTQRRLEIIQSFDKPLSPEQAYRYVCAIEDRGRLKVVHGRVDDGLEDFRLALDLITDDMKNADLSRAGLTGNIGWALVSSGNYDEGKKYMEESLHMIEQYNSPKSQGVLVALRYLATWAFRRQDYVTADSLMTVLLARAKEAVDPGHLLYSSFYPLKSRLLLCQDSVEQAIGYAKSSVEISKRATDFPSDDLMGSLKTLADAMLFGGYTDEAVQTYFDLSQVRRSFLREVFTFASETQKLRYVQANPPLIDALITGAIKHPTDQAQQAVFNMALNGKGLAVDVMAAEQTAAICSADPILDSLLIEHKTACSRIASLAVSGNTGSRYIVNRLDSLYASKDEIETEISLRCSNLDLRVTDSSVSCADVASMIPYGSALCEIVRYRRLDISTICYNRSLGDYYLALLLRKDGTISLVDLGEVEPTDSLVSRYHEVMDDALQLRYSGQQVPPIDAYVQVASALFDRIIAPIKKSLNGIERIYISPDGQLNLIPFESLTQDGKRFLIEDYEFVYLSSGRDLLRTYNLGTDRRAVVLTNPDYLCDPTHPHAPSFASLESELIFASRGETRSPDCLGSMFSPLPMTADEGYQVSELLSKEGEYDVTFLQADQASEVSFKNLVSAPAVLHLATHGYFCPEANRAELSNPLLRSGLILAGANRTIGMMDRDTAAAEDGVLTALEVSGLNLIGTDLVVLSACQTGIGEVQNGEGVFGLRRAFQHAGAKTVITSMFGVPDESTSDLMGRFYSAWQSGKSKSESLRQASLELLNDRRSRIGQTHPLFWGGFILIGDPN